MAEKSLKSHAVWSVVLQFSRFGGNALVFLVMARFLTIEQIGAFGMAYAPIRWTQVVHKSGILASVVVVVREQSDGTVKQDDPAFTALFWLASLVSLLVVALISALAWGLNALAVVAPSVDEMMLAMLIVPIAFGLSSVPEGLLHKLGNESLRPNALIVMVKTRQGKKVLRHRWYIKSTSHHTIRICLLSWRRKMACGPITGILGTCPKSRTLRTAK